MSAANVILLSQSPEADLELHCMSVNYLDLSTIYSNFTTIKQRQLRADPAMKTKFKCNV